MFPYIKCITYKIDLKLLFLYILINKNERRTIYLPLKQEPS